MADKEDNPSKKEKLKKAGKKVVERAKDPRIHEIVEKINKIVQVALFLLFIFVTVILIPTFMFFVFMILLFINLKWDVGILYTIPIAIFLFLEVLAIIGYLLARREVKEEIEEKLYLDNFVSNFFTGTVSLIAKVTIIIMAGILGLGGIAALVLILQFGFYKVGGGFVCVTIFLLGVGVIVVLVCALIKFVIKFIVGKAINKALDLIPLKIAKSAKKYTKAGEKEMKELEKKEEKAKKKDGKKKKGKPKESEE